MTAPRAAAERAARDRAAEGTSEGDLDPNQEGTTMMLARVVMTLIGVFMIGSTAGAACDPAGADAADVAAARAAIEATCDCAGATKRSDYLRCARTTAKAALANKGCVGSVMRCVNKSTCGKPGAVACCTTNAKGVTKATIKSNASQCRAPRGGSACVSPFTSACDACSATGCAPTPSPSPSPTPTPSPSPSPIPTHSPTPAPGGVCGDGVRNVGEDCDGATCIAFNGGQTVESECGAPDSAHPCECRAIQCGGCLEWPGPRPGDLCWSDDRCVINLGGEPLCRNGNCVATTCNSASECSDLMEFGCENGSCCVAELSELAFCSSPHQLNLPCCGNAICLNRNAPNPGFGVCCLPAGESCTGNEQCCNGTCAGGTCN